MRLTKGLNIDNCLNLSEIWDRLVLTVEIGGCTEVNQKGMQMYTKGTFVLRINIMNTYNIKSLRKGNSGLTGHQGRCKDSFLFCVPRTIGFHLKKWH